MLNTIFPVLVNVASGLGTALLLYLGGQTTRNGVVSPGDWFLFMQAVGFFWYPLTGHRFVLEPVPGRALGRRARLRADRRRAARGADRR